MLVEKSGWAWGGQFADLDNDDFLDIYSLASWLLHGAVRNHLFVNNRGQQFADVSGVSGLDGLADGRALALTDYDRDGWQDIVVVNSNTPLLNLYHNDIGRQAHREPAAAGVIALRFVGGNHTPQPSDSYSGRDGYGAAVTVDLETSTLVREHRCGEGLAAQNSATMLIGIGETKVADVVAVRWPSGVEQQANGIEAGTLLTVYENPDHSPSGEAFVRQQYRRPSSEEESERLLAATSATSLRLPFHGVRGTALSADDTALQPTLRMYTSTATWCAACKASLPQLRTLRAAFASRELALSGVPIDPSDGPDKLEAYANKYQPAYQLRTDLTQEQISAFSEILVEAVGLDALPSTLITDTEGRLLLAMTGLPTVSQLRKLLGETSGPRE